MSSNTSSPKQERPEKLLELFKAHWPSAEWFFKRLFEDGSVEIKGTFSIDSYALFYLPIGAPTVTYSFFREGGEIRRRHVDWQHKNYSKNVFKNTVTAIKDLKFYAEREALFFKKMSEGISLEDIRNCIWVLSEALEESKVTKAYVEGHLEDLGVSISTRE